MAAAARGAVARPPRRGPALGVAAIAVVTLVVLLGDGEASFLAGRLDSPLGYRNATAALFAFAAWPLIGFAARRGWAAARARSPSRRPSSSSGWPS